MSADVTSNALHATSDAAFDTFNFISSEKCVNVYVFRALYTVEHLRAGGACKNRATGVTQMTKGREKIQEFPERIRSPAHHENFCPTLSSLTAFLTHPHFLYLCIF